MGLKSIVIGTVGAIAIIAPVDVRVIAPTRTSVTASAGFRDYAAQNDAADDAGANTTPSSAASAAVSMSKSAAVHVNDDTILQGKNRNGSE